MFAVIVQTFRRFVKHLIRIIVIVAVVIGRMEWHSTTAGCAFHQFRRSIVRIEITLEIVIIIVVIVIVRIVGGGSHKEILHAMGHRAQIVDALQKLPVVRKWYVISKSGSPQTND